MQTSKNIRRSGELALLRRIALTVCVALVGVLNGPATSSGASSLTVDGANSPFAITVSTTYTSITDGNTSTGTINQTGSTAYITTDSGQFVLGYAAGSTGTYNLSIGTLSLTTTSSVVAVGSKGNGIFNQSGGNVTLNSATLYIDYLGGTAGISDAYNLSAGNLTTSSTQVGDDLGTATFNQTGGTHTTVTLGISGDVTGSVGIYNLTGGTLITGSIVNHDQSYTNTGTSTFNFNGGTLQASANSAAFMSGLTTANVQAGSGSGGAIINTNGFNITIGQNLVHDTTMGAAAIDGGLVVQGTGTLTLTGTNTYTGATAINSGSTLQLGNGSATGTLLTTSAITDNGTFAINRSGAVVQGTDFGTIGGSGGLTLLGGTLTLGTGNTYAGTTAINGGTLLVSNTTNSGVLTIGPAGTLQLGTGGTTGSISSNTTFTNNGTLAINRSNAVIQGTDFGTLTGTGSLSQVGSGTTTLNAANTYTGTTTVTGGTLQAGIASAADGSSGPFGNGSAVTLANTAGVTLDLNSFNTQIGSLSGGGTSGGNVTLGSATLITGNISTSYSGVISGTGGLTKIGTGTFSLVGAETYTGATTISAGTLQLGNGGTTGTLSTTSTITDNFIFAINRSNAVVQGTDFNSAAITGSGVFMQAGSGTTTLNVANTYSGGTKINAGILNLGVNSAINTTNGTISFGGGTLQYGSGVTTDYSSRLSVSAGQSINIDTNGQSVTFASQLTATTSTLNKLGLGTLTLSSSGNSFTGTTTISAGTLALGVGNTLGALSPSSAIVDNGTFAINRSNAVVQGTDFSTAVITGTGGLTLTAGTLTLNAANTFSGATAVNGGTLVLGGIAATDIQKSTLTPSGGAVVFSSTVTGNAFTVGGLAGTGNLTLANNATTPAAIALTVGNNSTAASYGGVLSGAGSLIKSGTGTQTLAGANTYTGATMITGGTLTAGVSSVAGTSSAFGNGSPVTVGVEGATVASTLNLAGFNESIGSLQLGAGSSSARSTIALGGGVLTVNGNIGYGVLGNGYYPATISGSGALDLGGMVRTFNVNNEGNSGLGGDLIITSVIQNGGITLPLTGLLTLSADNTYALPTTVSSGMLILSGTTGNVIQNSVLTPAGGTVDFSSTVTGKAFTVGGLAGSAALALTNDASAAIALTIGNNNTTGAVYSGVLSGTLSSVIKIGAGTQTFSGVNTYTGTTSINAGTLLVTNATGSGTGTGAVNVNAGTFGGTGTSTGAVTVAGGATIQGGTGTATGALKLNSTLTLNAGSIIALALGGSDGTHSTLARTGSGNWSFDTNQNFTFTGGANTTTYNGIITGLASDPGTESTWVITNMATNPSFLGSFAYDGMGDINLTITSVPEPATVFAGLLIVGVLGWNQRQRLASMRRLRFV